MRNAQPVCFMLHRFWFVASALLLLVAISFVVPAAKVSGQLGNGPLIWVDFQVLNQTKTMQLSGLGGLLVKETLSLTVYPVRSHNETGSLSMSGEGTYQIGEVVATHANIWTGPSNATVNSIDYTLLSNSTASTAPSQTIHVYNVPGALNFTLTVTYVFVAKGDYEATTRLNLTASNLQDTINLQVIYP